MLLKSAYLLFKFCFDRFACDFLKTSSMKNFYQWKRISWFLQIQIPLRNEFITFIPSLPTRLPSPPPSSPIPSPMWDSHQSNKMKQNRRKQWSCKLKVKRSWMTRRKWKPTDSEYTNEENILCSKWEALRICSQITFSTHHKQTKSILSQIFGDDYWLWRYLFRSY